MSLELLRNLNHDRQGLFAKFIDGFTNREPRLCWYPSAGQDLRDLFYLSQEYYRQSPPIGDSEGRAEQVPDLFIHTDYWIEDDLWFAEETEAGREDVTGAVIFQDLKTTIRILGIERLEDLPLHRSPALVVFPEGGVLSDRVYFLELEATSGEVSIRTHLLYVFVENVAFCRDVLLPSGARVAEVIHNRFGGGFGGGHARGGWLLHVLNALDCETFITDGRHLEWSGGDAAAMTMLSGSPHHRRTDVVPELGQPLREIDGRIWSNYGDKVGWYNVRG